MSALVARDTLREACLRTDYAAVRESGWMPVYTALSEWFAGKGGFGLPDLAAYADLLADVDPAVILTACKVQAGESQWRPTPADLYRRIQGAKARAVAKREAGKPRALSRPAPWQDPMALGRVRQLLEDGVVACECFPRPVNWHLEELDGRRWTADDLHERQMAFRRDKAGLPAHVLRCRSCDGIEQGQVWEATDAE